jgi:hypothetical protein
MKALHLLKRTQASIIRSEYHALGLSMVQAEQIAIQYRAQVQKINNDNPHLPKLIRLNPKTIEYSILYEVVRQWEIDESKKIEQRL